MLQMYSTCDIAVLCLKSYWSFSSTADEVWVYTFLIISIEYKLNSPSSFFINEHQPDKYLISSILEQLF